MIKVQTANKSNRNLQKYHEKVANIVLSNKNENKNATKYFKDTVPTAKLTIRIGQDQR